MLTKEKWAGLSKTIIGILMMALALAGSIGVQLTADDVNEIRVAVEAAFGAFGLLLALIGRFTAKSELYVNPFKGGGGGFALPFLVVPALAVGAVACETTISKADVAQLVIEQLEATLESAEEASKILSEDGTAPEELQIARVIIAAAKPQIVSWIRLVETLALSQNQSERVAELKARADVVVPPAEAEAIRDELREEGMAQVRAMNWHYEDVPLPSVQ